MVKETAAKESTRLSKAALSVLVDDRPEGRSKHFFTNVSQRRPSCA